MTAVNELQPGDHLGRYVVQRVLGSGALGTVYSAFDPQLDRAVAIKLLRADAASPPARAGFLREAQATAQLVHRNVVTIHDVGILGEQLFLAMELIDGPTLRAWLRTPRRWREVLAVMREAGQGLAAAHDAGIVHRDFKPENVLLAEASRRVVVTDFGLAFRGEEPTASDGALDRRADQHAFCVTLYEALWGEPPQDGVAPPDRHVPRWLRRVIARGLAPQPEDRWPDLRALLRALDPGRRTPPPTVVAGIAAVAVVVGIAVVADRDEPTRASYCDRVAQRLEGVWDPRIRRELETNFLATGEPSAADAARAVATRLDEFAAEWVDAQGEACRAEQDGSVAAEALALRMTCLDHQLGRATAIAEALRAPDRVAVLRSTDAVAHLASPAACDNDRQFARRAEARAAIDPGTQAELDAMANRAEALNRTAKYAEAETVATAELERASAIGDRWAVADALLQIASTRQWMQAPTAEQSFHDALNAGLAVEHHRVAVLSMLGLLEIWDPAARGGIARARQWEQHCSATLSALGGDLEIEVELAVAMGNAYLKNGDYDQAEASYQRALALPQVRDENVLLSGAHANLAAIAAARGSYREALAGFRRAYELLIEAYGPRHPNVAGAAVNVGSALAELGDLEGAREMHVHALEILEENFGPTHPSLAPALRMLAWNGLARHRYAEALPYAERALAIARGESGGQSESTARSLSMVAAITLELGRVDEARAQADEALAIARATLGDEHPTVAEFEVEAGTASARARDDAVARAHFARAIALREPALGPDDSEIGRAWAGLAELELARGRIDAAIDAATRAHEIIRRPENERGGAGPEAAFLLARALIARGRPPDQARARELAEQAETDFAAAGPAWQPRADEIAAWLSRSARE